MTVQTHPILQQIEETFNFEVDKFPLGGPDGLKSPLYGLWRSDTGEFASNTTSVTSQYVPHTTDDVKALSEAALTVVGDSDDVTCECYFRHGHYVNIQPSPNYRRRVFNTADAVFPRILIWAGYDGKAFKASLGTYRDMCSNLHIMTQVTGVTETIRHSGKLRSRMKELIAKFENITGRWDNVAEVIEQMNQTQVNVRAFLDTIYGVPGDGASGREVTIHKNRTEKIFNRLLRESTQLGVDRPSVDNDFTTSGWLAFNAVQGFVQHDATRKQGTSDFQRMLLTQADKNVRKAEELALIAV